MQSYEPAALSLTKRRCKHIFLFPTTAKKWNILDRSVRNYCALGKVDGAFTAGDGGDNGIIAVMLYARKV